MGGVDGMGAYRVLSLLDNRGISVSVRAVG